MIANKTAVATSVETGGRARVGAEVAVATTLGEVSSAHTHLAANDTGPLGSYPDARRSPSVGDSERHGRVRILLPSAEIIDTELSFKFMVP